MMIGASADAFSTATRFCSLPAAIHRSQGLRASVAAFSACRWSCPPATVKSIATLRPSTYPSSRRRSVNATL